LPMMQRLASLFIGGFSLGRLRTPGLGRTLAVATLSSIILRLGGMTLTLLVGIMLARMLGPEDLGVYGSVMAVAAILSVPAQFGLPQLVTREISASRVHDDPMQIRTILTWFFLLVLAGSAAMMLMAAFFWLPGGHVSDDLGSRIWGIALIPVTAVTALGMGMLRGLHRIVGAQVYDAVLRPSLMLLALSFAYMFGVSTDGELALALQAGTGTLVAILCVFHVYRLLPRSLRDVSSGPFDRRLIASAPPMAGTEILRVLDGQYAIVLLSLLAPAGDVGLFRVAMSLTAFVGLPSTIISLVTMSYIAELHRAGDSARLQKIARTSAQVCFGSTLIITLGLYLFGQSVIVLLFGSEYAGAWLPLVLISLAYTIQGFFGNQTTIMNMAGEEKAVLSAFLVSPVIGIAATVFLFPIVGLYAAAIAAILSYSAQSIFLHVRAKRRLCLDTAAIPLTFR
jgi:O-antigen/teichoic acid export membrane protein